jgi:hypothetical protein
MDFPIWPGRAVNLRWSATLALICRPIPIIWRGRLSVPEPTDDAFFVQMSEAIRLITNITNSYQHGRNLCS